METQTDSRRDIPSTGIGGHIKGIYAISDIYPELNRIRKFGLDCGVSTGWASLDHCYKVKKGMVSIVTGIPQSGKSEFLDALLVNLALMHKWKFAIFSPENYPLSLHAIKLAEKYVGKQFKNNLFPALSMTEAQITDSLVFIGDHFKWIYPEDEFISLELILQMAFTIQNEYGLDGLIIDPWNEIEHDRNGKSETDYISECLTKLRRFARKFNIHTWLVAHPQKMVKDRDGKYSVPTPYDISGSAHWRNKADFCICAHREDLTKDEVDVYVQKVKFKHLGKIGKVHFSYEWTTGRFKEE